MRYVFTTTLLILIFLSIKIEACSCRLEGVCQSYNRAKSVFTGKLISLRNDDTARAVYANFKVDRVFKGKLGTAQIVRFFTGGCGPQLEIGKNYFVYDDQDLGGYAQFCNRTFKLSGKDEDSQDLKYVNSLSKTRPIFTIAGEVSALLGEDNAEAATREIKVTIQSGKYRQKQTISGGDSYSFVVTRNTSYKVSLLLPFILKTYPKDVKVKELEKGSLVEFTRSFKPNECIYDVFKF